MAWDLGEDDITIHDMNITNLTKIYSTKTLVVNTLLDQLHANNTDSMYMII